MSALEIVALLAIGAGIGAYAGAIGAGGGFLVAPLLLWRHADAPPEAITAASLSVAALVSGAFVVLGLRDGRIDRPLVLVLGTVSVAGALAGAAATSALPRDVFAIGFALLLTALAASLMARPALSFLQPGARGWRRLHRDREGTRFAYRVPLRRSLPVGFAVAGLSALAGIGGGILLVPLANRVMRMPHWLTVPTAQGVVFVIALSGASFQIAAGNADWSNKGPMADALWLGVGVLLAAPLGRLLNRRLGEGRLTRLLAIGILAVVVQTILSEI